MKTLPLSFMPRFFKNSRCMFENEWKETDFTICAISEEGDSVTIRLEEKQHFRVDDLHFNPYKVIVIEAIRLVYNLGRDDMRVVSSMDITVYED